MTGIEEIGGTSQDLRTLGYPDPAEAHLAPDATETAIRTAGRRSFIIGLTIGGTAFTAALTGVAVGAYSPSMSPNVRMFGTLALIVASAVSSAFIADGRAERRDRERRAMVRLLVRQGDANTKLLETICVAVDLIAARLPEDQALQNWRGWAAAERARETEGTGTTGPGSPRPTHLGLVKHDQPPHG